MALTQYPDVNIHKYGKVPSLIEDCEANYLCHFVKGNVNTGEDIVNIGVYYGASVIAMLLGLDEQRKQCRIFTIDPLKYAKVPEDSVGIKTLRERTDVDWVYCNDVYTKIKKFVKNCVIWSILDFSDSVPFSTPVKLVFVDGDHSVTGCLLDALKYGQHVVPGGFMLFHDYNNENLPTVKKAVDIFLSIRTDFEIVETYYSILTIRKKING